MRIKEKSKKDKNILIIGSGFAGISFYKEFHKLIHERSDIKITILSENNYFLFTPLLHEVATGNLLPEDIITPIRENFFCCTREIIIDKALYIDVLKKQVKLKKTSVDYDYLVIATGASTNFFNIKGVKEYAYPLKDIHDSIRLKNGIVSLFEKAEMEKWKKIDVVLVGGGATGIELSVEISEFIEQLKPYYKNLREEDVELRVKILNASENFIPDFPQKVRKKVLSFFSNINSKVSIVLNSRVKVVEENKVILDNRKAVNYDFLVWSAGVKPIIPSNNLGIDVLKRIPVNQFLQTESENVFAIGDVAAVKNLEGGLYPQLAQIAEEEAKICALNIYNDINHKPKKPFLYNLDSLLLSLGHNNAIVYFKGILITGKSAWILWKFIYLVLMFNGRSKVMTAFNWISDQFSPRDISKI